MRLLVRSALLRQLLLLLAKSCIPHGSPLLPDEAQENAPSLDLERCEVKLFSGCNIAEGKCVCSRLHSCSNPFSFPSWGACRLRHRQAGEATNMALAPPACPTADCALTKQDCAFGLQLDRHGCSARHCVSHATTAVSAPTVEAGSCRSKDGRHYGNGEKWSDGCRDCYCRDGREVCSLITCPARECENLVLLPDRCCPSCPDSQMSPKPNLRSFPVCLAPELSSRMWSLDSCTQCICQGTQLLCERKECPPLLCQRPIRTKDSCCAQCPDDALTPPPRGDLCSDRAGRTFSHGESWRLEPCSSCICWDGAVKCFPESCPPLDCPQPVLHAGQCCPYCMEEPAPRASCHFGGHTYADEERWEPDVCTHCYCLQGQTLCSTVSCPALSCRSPAHIRGACCPVCAGEDLHTVPAAQEPPHWDSPISPPAIRAGTVAQFTAGRGSPQRPAPGLHGDRGILGSVMWAMYTMLAASLIVAALLAIRRGRQQICGKPGSAPAQMVDRTHGQKHSGLVTDSFYRTV